jgi:hypothetical protein
MNNNPNFYAGIGSRETPDNILVDMNTIAMKLAYQGYILRSGGAKGADSAFELGCDLAEGTKQIFKANDATVTSIKLASQYHPAWHRCNDFVKKLHARNGLILLGRDLSVPVKCIICWTPYGKVTGGTGQAMRIAIDKQIPIYNLAVLSIEEVLNKLF